jgi:hypothetical protein
MNARLGIIGGSRFSEQPASSFPIPALRGYIRSIAESMSPVPLDSSETPPLPAPLPSAPCNVFTVFLIMR